MIDQLALGALGCTASLLLTLWAMGWRRRQVDGRLVWVWEGAE